MNNFSKHIVLVSLFIAAINVNVFAQKTELKTTRIRIEYFRNHDSKEILIATLRIKEDRYKPLLDSEVKFSSIDDTTSVVLGKIRTNENGEARFVINDQSKILKDSLGEMTFEVEYIGNKQNKGSDRKITVKQANLDMSFFQKDSTKYIEINVAENNNEKTAITDIKVRFYIKGTFSQLKFGEEKTDENGKVKIEFPVEMPGDSLGVLTIVSKIEEDKEFGTIESRGVINWGIPVPLVKEKQRGLGDTDAPLWMVYTLIILLSAVWFHYMYVIFLIIKIKLAK